MPIVFIKARTVSLLHGFSEFPFLIEIFVISIRNGWPYFRASFIILFLCHLTVSSGLGQVVVGPQ